MSKIHSESLTRLFEGILRLENVDECYDFFEDICTITEILAMKQRFEVATLLNQDMLYSDIVSKTRASTATISRVNKALEYGNDGYKTVLERLKNEGL
ncbi:MAG: YerC/YecD family TrpR-related protein [Clostridia bacterium]